MVDKLQMEYNKKRYSANKSLIKLLKSGNKTKIDWQKDQKQMIDKQQIPDK